MTTRSRCRIGDLVYSPNDPPDRKTGAPPKNPGIVLLSVPDPRFPKSTIGIKVRILWLDGTITETDWNSQEYYNFDALVDLTRKRFQKMEHDRDQLLIRPIPNAPY